MSETTTIPVLAGSADATDIETMGPAPKSWAVPLVRTISIIVVFVAWEYLGRQVSPLFMSYPTAILQAAWRLSATGELWKAAASTLQTLGLGFIIGVIFAIVLGLLIGRYRYFEAAVNWAVLALYAMPQVAIVPLIVLWLGYGDATKLFIVINAACFPVIINTVAGVRNVPAAFIDVGRAFDINERDVFGKIILPSAVPYMMAGIRLAVGRAIIGTVVGEFFTAVTGLGAMIVKYGNMYQTAAMFVPILMLMTVGVLLTAGAQKLERMVAPWNVPRDA